jgi:hypothetical protein
VVAGSGRWAGWRVWPCPCMADCSDERDIQGYARSFWGMGTPAAGEDSGSRSSRAERGVASQVSEDKVG